MFFYVCLILLPATAMAGCNANTIWDFVKVLDANKDSGVDKPEAYAFFESVDLDKNKKITLREAQLTFPFVASIVKGKEEEIIYYLDLDGDGQVSVDDAEQNFKKVDLDNNGIKSKDEYKGYIPTRCRAA